MCIHSVRQHIQIPLVGIAILLSITVADQCGNGVAAAHCSSCERVGFLAMYVRLELQANLDKYWVTVGLERDK